MEPILHAEKFRHFRHTAADGWCIASQTFQSESQLVPHLVGNELVFRALLHKADARGLRTLGKLRERTAVEKKLFKKKNPALLPIQIAYYTGLRIGEACSLTWQDIDLKEQRLTVRRSIRYNSARHRTEIGTTKRKKIRSVDFCNTLAEILKEAKKTQMLDRLACGPLYSQNYYLTIEEKNRTYYEVYSLPVSEHPPEGYQAISLVCVRQDGRYESPATVSNVCRAAKKRVDGMESFHFHQLRHTFTSNLLSYGAAPKDVQELLGHSDVTTTMNLYAHASREAKRDAAKLLDKVQ